MSEPNVPQQWKREESCTSSVVPGTSGCGGFYTKTNVVALGTGGICGGGTRIISESTSSSSPPSSVSSFSSMIATGGSSTSAIVPAATNLSTGGRDIYSLPQQVQPLPPPSIAGHHPPSNFDLLKLSSISKMNNLAKMSGLEGATQSPEEEKLRKLQQMVETGISDHAKQQILQILDKVSLLKPPERLLLYLRLPGGTPETDPLRQPQNPLGTRSEINHTINWVRSHLEHDPKVSIPKQDVYNDYLSYCERVNIKPLSTADFGKVMKQVFPEIRPRRLGTRGHSRYCYAAMRKATKLDPPRLPDLNLSAKISDVTDVADDESWNVIKSWAEGLLNANFTSSKDLASYITKHHSSSPAANSSRLLLQKKLLQRETKEKRKFVDTSPIKKRRKKKRRTSSSSESTAIQSMTSDTSIIDIKQEIIDPVIQHPTVDTQALPMMTSFQAGPHLQQQPQPQQMVPMNLVATEHASNKNHNLQKHDKIQGTNLACDNNDLVVGCLTTKTIVAPNLSSPICAPPATSLVPVANINNSPGSKPNANLVENLINKPLMNPIKEEIPDSYDSKVYCKKVRQAQQAKGLWNPAASITQPGMNTSMLTVPEIQNNVADFSVVKINDGLMGPPAQLDPDGFKGISNNGIQISKSPYLNIQRRAKKLENNTKLENMQEQDGVVKDGNGESVLSDNLGLPRERVISICNMDKHELDDYLNAEENSQDQEAELLQYFQQEDSEEKSSNGTEHGPSMNYKGQIMSVLENYQLYGNRMEKKGMNQNEEEINQLRYYLQQNFQNNKDLDVSGTNKSMDQTGVYGGMYTGGSASASLAMMSQRHHSTATDERTGIRCCTTDDLNQQMAIGGGTLPQPMRGRRKINLNARSIVPNSPNTRRKNFSFVPISPSGQPSALDYSPFVSPRNTPVVRKPPLHKQQSLPTSDHHGVSDHILASVGTRFGKLSEFSNPTSASAPPSPSLVPQRFRFAPNSLIQNSSITGFSSGSGSLGEEVQFLPSIDVQCRGQIINTCNVSGNGESRSQSVPLHSHSPQFNHSSNYAGFASACSSVAQTPVPPEFADFSDPSSILDIFADASQPSIKLESSEIAPILDDITSTESALGVSHLLSKDFDIKNNNSTISRSVPSTPLPMNHYKIKSVNCCDQSKMLGKMYDVSKSVPTTPNAMVTSSFRYSPDFNKDFLINGNTIDLTSKVFSQAVSSPSVIVSSITANAVDDSTSNKILVSSLPENVDELSNYGMTESIIGSDILSNL